MIFSFYSKAERNGEITLGQNKILHLWCGSLQGSLHGWQRRLQTALMPLPFSSPFSLLPHTHTHTHAHTPPLLPRRSCFSLSISGEREEKDGRRWLFWSMTGNQTMGREDVKQIGPITYLPTRIPQSLLSPSLSIYLSLTSVSPPHIQTCIWPQTCCKKHTAAPDSDRQRHNPHPTHTHTHTHTLHSLPFRL